MLIWDSDQKINFPDQCHQFVDESMTSLPSPLLILPEKMCLGVLSNLNFSVCHYQFDNESLAFVPTRVVTSFYSWTWCFGIVHLVELCLHFNELIFSQTWRSDLAICGIWAYTLVICDFLKHCVIPTLYNLWPLGLHFGASLPGRTLCCSDLVESLAFLSTRVVTSFRSWTWCFGIVHIMSWLLCLHFGASILDQTLRCSGLLP